MKHVFLGPALHWLILLAIIAVGWVAGKMRLHVSEFNPFMIALIFATVLIVIGVLRTSPAGQRVTRDPIEESDENSVSPSS